MLANAGKNLSVPTMTDDFTYRSQQIWSDGLGIFFTNDMVLPGDQIKILIFGPMKLQL